MVLSVVSPVYNSVGTIYNLVDEIKKTLIVLTSDFEIILVDDGSIDNSWQIIEELCAQHSNIKGIKLLKNYGQHKAILAGLEYAKGNWIVVMDCDLQDNPAEIAKLFVATNNDFKIVMAKRMNRKDSFLKKYTSYLFWNLISFVGNIPIHPIVGNYGIYHKDVISYYISLKNEEPYFSIAMQKFNFKRKMIDVEHQARGNEKSSYSIIKLLKHAKNILIYAYKVPSKKFNNYNIEKQIN